MNQVGRESTSDNKAGQAVQEASTLLHLMIRGLVDRPEAVKVDMVEGGQSVIFEVRVDREDVRRVIGRKGRTADALREIMTNLGGKAGRRYLLEIVEPAERFSVVRS